MKKAALALDALAATATLLIIAVSLGPADLGWRDGGVMAPLVLWNLAPFLVLATASTWLARGRLQHGIVLAATLAVAIIGPGLLFDALILDRHILNYLLLIAMPHLLWMIVLPALVITALVRFIEHRRRTVDGP